MDRKIIFQKCNFNYIYFLFYILTSISMNIIDNYLDPELVREGAKQTDYDYINKQILEVYTFIISDFFALIPYFISKKLTISKNKNNNNERSIDNESSEKTEDKEQLQLIYNDFIQTEYMKRRKTIIFYLIIIASFDFLKDFVFVLYYSIFYHKDYAMFPFSFCPILDIILQFIFSYLILKTHFYKLQKCTLYLNICILVIISIFDILDIHSLKLTDTPIYFFFPFHLIFYSLTYVFGKKIITYGYVSIYLIIIMKGVIKFIIIIVFSLSVFIFQKELFIAFGIYFKKLYVLLIIAKIFSNFFSELFVWIIVDRFSPNHTPLIILGDELCLLISDLMGDKPNFNEMGWFKYIRIVLYIISFIGVIIHNEIVVINICGLASDTKYFLDMMAKNEEEYIKADNPDILKRFETLEMIDLEDDDTVYN